MEKGLGLGLENVKDRVERRGKIVNKIQKKDNMFFFLFD